MNDSDRDTPSPVYSVPEPQPMRSTTPTRLPSRRALYHEFRAYDAQHESRRRWLVGAGSVLAATGLVCAIIGCVEFALAERERLHGWYPSVCEIRSNHAANDSSCIYLTVAHADHGPLCAVPALVAAQADFHEPPACHGHRLPPAERSDLEYWRSIGSGTVECLVPNDLGAVPADRCIESATSRSLGAAVWRSYVERFIYLVHTRRDGSDALTNVTSARRGAALVALLSGIVAAMIGLMAVFATQCVSLVRTAAERLPNPSSVYRERRAREHHLH